MAKPKNKSATEQKAQPLDFKTGPDGKPIHPVVAPRQDWGGLKPLRSRADSPAKPSPFADLHLTPVADTTSRFGPSLRRAPPKASKSTIETAAAIVALNLQKQFAKIGDSSDRIAVIDHVIERLMGLREQIAPAPIAAPEAAPALWSDRDQAIRETAPEFIRRVYEPWLRAGSLARRDILALDEPLYKAYGVRISRHPDEAIAELEDQTDWVDRAVADLADRYSTEDLRKLGLALEYRRKRRPENGR